MRLSQNKKERSKFFQGVEGDSTWRFISFLQKISYYATVFLLLLPLCTSVWSKVASSQVVKKISIKREKENHYVLCIDFDEKVSFVPRIHTLPCGLKILLSFGSDVEIPPAARGHSGSVIRGLFFEKFSSSSLMFVCALRENVTFISKKYTDHSIKIEFLVNKKHTVIIDAGHGGKDPGAKSIIGSYEKNVTLVTAIELRNALLRSGKYRVILTRDRDEFISMEERVNKINSSNADILISLHTDSNDDKNLRGLSIYVLPSLDQIRDKSDIEDIQNYEKIRARSLRFAKNLTRYIPNCCRMGNRSCRDGDLKILKIGIPAALVELGCCSNKIDSELLHSKIFRAKTVKAILYALDKFFER
jgi:N-acetylmuramoyl-L-alanine amidase